MHPIAKPISALLALCLLLTGCKTLDSLESTRTEDLLTSAGFVAKPADTAAKQAQLQQVTPYRVMPIAHPSGTFHYIYADVKNNRLYYGDPAAFEKFQKLYDEERPAAEQEMAAFTNDDPSLDWAGWELW